MNKIKESRKAIVIGATSGIGKEVVKVLTDAGWLVGIAGRRQGELQKIQSLNFNIIATECIDITKDDASEHLTTLIGKMGGIDLYFHSSGIGFQNRELNQEKEISTVETNAVGMTRMINTAFHYFKNNKEKKGIIAVISSIAATKGLGPAPAYSASKRYVSHYMECLTHLCHINKIKNIRLLDIRPGFVKTPLLNDGTYYPMQMDASFVATKIVKAINGNKNIMTIDWKYKTIVFFWKMIPRWLWVRIKI